MIRSYIAELLKQIVSYLKYVFKGLSEQEIVKRWERRKEVIGRNSSGKCVQTSVNVYLYEMVVVNEANENRGGEKQMK